tara:strand:- start:1008 stop:1829 length:822 start_codon:yes stop_codon:yes gene_type:complete
MYTLFGYKGFIGSEIKKYLRNKNKKIFLPGRNQIKFRKNLGNVIYCIGSDDWKKYPKKGFESNLGHLKNILFENKFNSFLFLSTSRVYLNNSVKSSKEDEFINVKSFDINNYYNLLKLTSEAICLSLKNKNIKIVRLSNVLGNNYYSPLVLPSLIRSAIKTKKIKLLINKNSTKDYIGIKDVIELIFKIKKSGKEKLYNVASGKNIKLIEIAKIIRKETKCKIILKNQNIKVNEPKINISKIRNEFNFKQTIDTKKQIKNIISNFKKFYKIKK